MAAAPAAAAPAAALVAPTPPPSLGGGGGSGGYGPPPPPGGGAIAPGVGQAQTTEGTAECGMSTGTGFVLGVIFGLAVVGGGLFYKDKKDGGDGKGFLELDRFPFPQPGFGGVGGGGGGGGGGTGKTGALPAGWIEADAPDGKKYYYNQNTGATSWEKPTA